MLAKTSQLTIGITGLLGLASCVTIDTSEIAATDAAEIAPTYRAEITETEFGIPHIIAADYGSLGFGEGYMAASDHTCNIAHIILRAKGELSKYLGPGEDNENFLSDYAVRGLGLLDRYETGYEKQPDQLRALMEGYAAGFNKHLSDYEASGDETLWCHGEAWVQPLTGKDIFARGRYTSETLPRLGGALFAAQPPSGDQKQAKLVSDQQLDASQEAVTQRGFGSNAWAIGSDWSETGGGMLLANPHYPWFGSNRFWEKHLTIPGEMDAYGVSLVGTPGVLIGFNKDIAWSHTVSASQRLVPYTLTLSNDDPMTYAFDGEFKDIEARNVVVPVKGEDGVVTDLPAVMYFSHQGPIIALRGMNWSEERAFAVRDANRDNDNTIAQWFDMSRADSMEAFIDAHRKWNALPWVNTIATSRDGQATYLDNSTVGHLSEEAIIAWQEAYAANPAIQQAYDERRLTILDGSTSKNDFVETGAPIPGTAPFDQRPQITRRDYVFNANDSYWLSSPRAPLSGYSPLYGPTETARSLRTRMNILHLQGPSTEGTNSKWSIQDIQTAILSNQSLAADVFKPELVAVCEANTDTLDSTVCDVLTAYDGHLNADSKGAVLFREWLYSYRDLSNAAGTDLFKTPFSVEDAVNTPAGLNDETIALDALHTAVDILDTAGIAIDAPLGDVQIAIRGAHRIPMHGGYGLEGNANLIDQRGNDTTGPFPKSTEIAAYSNLTDKGYLVSGGTSFIMTLAFGEDGPTAEAFLTYGQSGTPEDENYSDQTKLFADKAWRKIRFSPEEVAEGAVRTVTLEGY
ncbi:MAG: penicillin acylase family protein [Pseudomonadota bacterium]